MSIKRSFWTGQIKEIDGEKVKRGFFSGEMVRIGGREVQRESLSREIRKVGDEKVERSWWTGRVTEAPAAYYKAKLVDEDDARLYARSERPPAIRSK